MFGNCQPNRTPIWLGSVMEHNQTHNNIWSIEKNGMLNCRTVDNRTQSNVRLPNPFVYRSFLKYCKHFVRCTAPWLVLHDLLYQETDSEQNRIGLSSIVFDWFENRTHSRIDVWFCLITEPNWTIGVRLERSRERGWNENQNWQVCLKACMFDQLSHFSLIYV